MVLGLTLLLVLGQVVHLAHRVVAGVALGVVLGLIARPTRHTSKGIERVIKVMKENGKL